jgi:hypothetical protein
MIAQMVWEEREDNLVKMFEESDGEESERKRLAEQVFVFRMSMREKMME